MIILKKFKRLELNSGFNVKGVNLFYVKTSKNGAHNIKYGAVVVNRNTLCEVDSSMVKPWWKIW